MRLVELISSYSKQVQQKKTKDPTVCEFDEVYDRIKEGSKMAVAAKLGKNKEMKPQDKQTESGGQEKGPTKQEVK